MKGWELDRGGTAFALAANPAAVFCMGKPAFQQNIRRKPVTKSIAPAKLSGRFHTSKTKDL
jgi:hypothetical protein